MPLRCALHHLLQTRNVVIVMLIVINYKMTTFFSNDNSNCNTILSLEGNGNGNWYREYGNGNTLQSISN